MYFPLTFTPNFLENTRAFFYLATDMKASVKHIRISPKKANLVAGLVRGKPANEALVFLQFANKKAADILHKLIASAVANAENNDAKSANDLIIDKLVVTKGRTYRRGIPASRGRMMPILKRSSHIFVELGEQGVAPAEPEAKAETTEPKAEKGKK
jgi:large subunit ribosomal protein L22